MIFEIPKKQIVDMLIKQLDNMFVFDEINEKAILEKYVEIAFNKLENNFSANKNKYFKREEKVYFNPFHSGQYCIFLYYLSNSLKDHPSTLKDRIYYLNKTLNSVDLFYEIELPAVFFLEHPVGTVMGRARYSNYFSFSQNCTIGNNKGKYPQIEENVTMLSGSKIIGESIIGKNTIIAANTYIKDAIIPPNSLVFGSSPNLIIKKRGELEVEEHFQIHWKKM